MYWTFLQGQVVTANTVTNRSEFFSTTYTTYRIVSSSQMEANAFFTCSKCTFQGFPSLLDTAENWKGVDGMGTPCYVIKD